MMSVNQEVIYTLSLKDLLSGKISNANREVNRFESSLAGVGRAAASVAATVGLVFSGAAVVAFGRKMIESGTYVENALTGLTTLLRDKAEAQQVVNNTMEDATKTPFAFEGLLMANKALISAGVSAQDARADVLNLANAIAATGGGDDELQRMVVNMQQIKNTGKATAADIKQFAFAGVNIYKILADATGKTTEEVKDMEVSYDLLTMALKKAHDEGGAYAGGLENMANNTSVRISNLGDSVFQLGVTMFNDLKPAIDGVVNGLAHMVELAARAWEWLKRNKDTIEMVTIAIIAGAAAYAAYNLVMNAALIATSLETAAMLALGTAVEWVNAMFLASPIGWIVLGVAAITAAVIYCYNHFGKFRAVIWATWSVIKEFVSIAGDVFMGLGKTIAGVLTFSPSMIAEGIDQTVGAVKNAASRIGKAAKEGYEAGLADFNESQAAKGTVSAPKAPTKPGTKPFAQPSIDKKETKGAQGAKALTINIKIDSVIKDFQVKTTNIYEAPSKVREIVTQAVLAALNDSQIIAGE